MKKKCGKKKIIILLKEISLSLILTFCFAEALAQSPIINMSYFEQNGGVQLLLEDDQPLDQILVHPGIQLDHGSTPQKVYLYASQSGYNFLLENKIHFSTVPIAKVGLKMKDISNLVGFKSGVECLPHLDFYPTYEAYEEMLLTFEKNHSDICQIINLGTLSSGRKILAAKISGNLHAQNDKPNFLYSSTMHGDETAGFPIMLQLIDHLLCNYNEDARITNLVNEINIFINPLANPNGTYRAGNDSVAGAIRYNSSFADLNRNFPDPEDGLHPDGKTYQEETTFFMAFADSVNIHLACNIHGGAEVANYPWDTFAHYPADWTWWEELCRSYADTVHNYSSENYFTDLNNGVTNGYAWYEVRGGRQDYMTYYKRAREFTLEISSMKLLDSNLLPEIWSVNKNALLNYMEESLFGLRGIIVDCVTGQPLKAEIIIPDHDIDNSSVFSDSITGRYFRFLDNGTYEVLVKSSDYEHYEFIANISDKQSLTMNVELCPIIDTSIDDTAFENINYTIIDKLITFNNLPTAADIEVVVYDAIGRTIQSNKLHNKTFDFKGDLNPGIYWIQISTRINSKIIPVFIN